MFLVNFFEVPMPKMFTGEEVSKQENYSRPTHPLHLRKSAHQRRVSNPNHPD